MCRSIIAAAAVLAVAVGLAFWAYAEGDDSAEAGMEVVRWGNVTVSVPEGSGVAAARDFAPAELNPPDGGQMLVLIKGESRLAIDADTGEVIHDSVEAAERAAIDQVLATLEIKEFDEKARPWPYGSARPSTQRQQIGNITYIPPDPASGIAVHSVIVDYFDRPSALIIKISNGRSGMSVNTMTGLVNETTMLVAAEDEEAFQRFLSEIELVEP